MRTFIFTIAIGVLAGCAGPRSPGLISHVVFVELKSPTDAEALLRDSQQLAGIDGVVSFAAGPHIDTGRASVRSDYDIGLIIGFDSEEDYAAYVTDPVHVEFVESWKPAFKALRVYDIHDGPFDRD